MPEKTQLVTVGDERIVVHPAAVPPPAAELPAKVQLATVGAKSRYTSRRRSRRRLGCRQKMQLVTVGDAESLYIPPPEPFGPAELALPPVTVKPSSVPPVAPTTT